MLSGSDDPKRPKTPKKYAILNKIYDIRSELPVILLSSFLIVSLINMLIIKTSTSAITFTKDVNLGGSLRNFALLSVLAVFLRLNFFGKRFTMRFLLISSYAFGVWVIYEFPKDLYLTLGCILIVGAVTYFSYREESDSFTIVSRISEKRPQYVIVFLFIAVTTLLILASIFRHRAFGSSNFDFGIFAQVFEYLKTTGLPLTSSERNKLISHFTVHLSPIYYMILPGYMLFSHPEYLLVVQAILVCSAIFPIYLLCRHYNFSRTISTLISATYIFFPGTVGPVMFDFHENKFLTVLILWMIYFYEKKKPAPMYIFMVLTFMVKEDAALYILFLGLFFLLSRKDFIHGSIISFSTLLYFISAVTIINKFGEGVMDYRFLAYLQEGEKGLTNIFKNIILDPAYFAKNIFTKAKLEYVLYMMTPLLFVPLISKEFRRLILLVPMVLINLMTPYPYQSNIGYQYTYGVAAILFFMFIINLRNFKMKHIAMICIISVFASFTLTITSKGELMVNYAKSYLKEGDKYALTEKVLEKIPTDASVTATTFMVPHLYKVKILYMFPSKNITDYFVADTRINDKKTKDEIDKMVKDNGYTLVDSGGIVNVYKRQ